MSSCHCLLRSPVTLESAPDLSSGNLCPFEFREVRSADVKKSYLIFKRFKKFSYKIAQTLHMLKAGAGSASKGDGSGSGKLPASGQLRSTAIQIKQMTLIFY